VKQTGYSKRRDYDFFYGKGNVYHQLGTGTVKRVEFVRDRLSYIVLRGRWHNFIVVNVHALSEGKVMS